MCSLNCTLFSHQIYYLFLVSHNFFINRELVALTAQKSTISVAAVSKSSNWKIANLFLIKTYFIRRENTPIFQFAPIGIKNKLKIYVYIISLIVKIKREHILLTVPT